MGAGTGVAKGKTRDVALERRWRRIMIEHRRSGLSVREFCRQGQITEASFYHWRSELHRRRGTSPSRRRVRQAAGSASPAFVAVRVAPPAAEPVGGRIEIVLAGDRRIHVSGPVDRAALADVVAVLEGASC